MKDLAAAAAPDPDTEDHTTDAEVGDEPGDWVRRAVAGTIGVLVVIGLVWIGIQALNVLILVFAAVLLAAGLEPAVDSMRKRLPIGLGSSILLGYGLFAVSVVAVAFLVVPTAVGQIDRFTTELPASLDRAREWAQTVRPEGLSSMVMAVIDSISGNFAGGGAPKPDDVVSVGLTVAEAVASLVTLLTLVFFWMTEHARLQRYALAFVSLERRAGMRQAWDEVETRLGLWVRGQLILMGSMAVATGAIYSVLGLPSALLLGIIAGLAEAIPLVGPLIGVIPALVVAATVDDQLVLAVAIAYIVIQFVEGNILVPMVMRNTIRLSSFLVIASLLVGGAVGGLVGAFLAVPIVAAVEVILERFQARESPVTQAPGGIKTDDEDADEIDPSGETAGAERPLQEADGLSSAGP